MRHHNKNRKFGRTKNQRVALIKGLALSLIKHERIETTLAKAKELRPYVEKLVTRAKVDTLASRRITSARLGNQATATTKLYKDLGPKYKTRPGGYTRIVKLAPRKSDASPMAIIEFV
jgi:large subunit ribosomal protein L17